MLRALMCFEGNSDWNDGAVWSCATSPLYPIKRARPKSKLKCIVQVKCLGVNTYASCEKPVILDSLDHWEALHASPFRHAMADYICSFSYFVASLRPSNKCYTFGYPYWNKHHPLTSISPLISTLYSFGSKTKVHMELIYEQEKNENINI